MKSLLPPKLQKTWRVRDTVSRRDRLIELAMAGYQIPTCGLFGALKKLGRRLVVYTDDKAHRGEGKLLWTPPHSYWWDDNLFCSVYVPGYESSKAPPTSVVEGKAVSYRRLVVGSWEWRLRYTSTVCWESNWEGTYEVLYRTQSLNRDRDVLPYPMYAVDYTETGSDYTPHAYHFDLNVCPGVPIEVVNELGRDVLTESVAKFCKDRGLV